MSADPKASTQRLSAHRFGIGLGLTGVLFYAGCTLTMATVPREIAVKFFNNLLHGLDISPILRTDISLVDVVVGIVTTFLLGWVAGILTVGFYNFGLGTSEPIETGNADHL